VPSSRSDRPGGERPFSWRAPDGLALAGALRRGAEPQRHPLVVLVHGLASNRTRWSEFVASTRLGAAQDLLRVDLRGHGESPTLGPVGLELWSGDLQAALDALGARQAIVVGHSLGAQVGLHLAAHSPNRVVALVLIDPVFRQALSGDSLRRARQGPRFAALARLVRGLYRLGLYRRRLAPLDLEAMDRAARVALAEGPEAEAAFIRHYSSAWADLRSFRTAHYLQEMAEMARPAPDPATIRAPTLVLLSTGATFARLEDSLAVAAGFPNGTVATIDCHHWPVTEKPVEVRERIEAWIEGVCADGVSAHCAERRA
jgi:pimeloyl-ACP methyl ester carboxylesterase